MVCTCVASLAGVVLVRPLGRWTTPRELVVMGDPFVFDDARTITFEGWTITRDATGDVLVRRGMSEPESVMPVHPVLVQSDEAGTFLRTHRSHCGQGQHPRVELRIGAFLLGLVALASLAVLGHNAHRRAVSRRIAEPESSATYRATGRPTRDDVDLWRAIERDATEVCAAALGAALLVATWSLAFVDVL